MLPNPSPLIQPSELLSIRTTKDWVLIDASNGPGAAEAYAKSHLEGARHVDLNTDLATILPDAAVGGRHPLPSPAKFAQVLSRLGITPSTPVMVYDSSNAANAAARFWWMLKAIGHAQVQVVDGGMQAAVAAGFPVSSEVPVVAETAPYPVAEWNLPLADIAEIDRIAQDPRHLVIDVRDNYRYLGESEPIDLIAGHIPGAINVPFSTNLDENGSFLGEETLRAKYLEVFGNRKAADIVVHCGSGVTACHTLLAVAAAGLAIPKLYVGSWSEWSRNNRPMVTMANPGE
ncbi:MAG: hypothetical protein RLZZ519_1473 [Bacteroidota bacterium]|jgi:thiosulfate/3-mercaptopyruvate sulfurtransferase